MKTKINIVVALVSMLVVQQTLMAQSTAITNTLTGTLPASPTEYLGSYNDADVIFKSTSVERMRINSLGNVGIGTSNPNFAKLHVAATTDVNNTPDSKAGLSVEKTTATNQNRRVFIVPHLQVGGFNWLPQNGDLGLFWTDGTLGTSGQNASAGFVISPWRDSNIGLRITAQGNVGIGTPLVNNPNNYKLAVNGKIGAHAVQVDITSTTWPDYVFDEKYTLKSINELEAFINKNKHLPNVPSANEVGKNGIDLGSMNASLLEKIEELSLYIIQQNKQIEQIKQQLKILEKREL